jgi:hypothetical protein
MNDLSLPATPYRRRRLAAALAGASFAAAAVPAGAATDQPWARLRSEPVWPLFGSLSEPGRRPASTTPDAATHVVSNCDDDGPGSLRATIAAAGESDTVDLSQLQCGRITLETGAIPIQVDNLTLVGGGPGRSIVDGGQRDRLFIHYGFGTLTLEQLTVSGGYYRATGHDVAFGGCIAARSYLSLDHAVVRDCKAIGVGSYGGGTFSYALLMRNSTISGNLAAGRLDQATTAAFGGGAYAYVVSIADSTITGNRADYQTTPPFDPYGIGGGLMAIIGGGIYNSTIDSNFSQGRGGGVATFVNLVVSNSTISGNQAQAEFGGGLFMRWPSTLQLDNSTIAFNHAGLDAGGIWLNAPGSSFRSSIVFGNSVAGQANVDIGEDVGNQTNLSSPASATSIDGGNSLVGSYGTLLTLPPDTLSVDPQLAPLDWNGGRTRTHALRADSPAVDAGSNAGGLASDQRGEPFARVHGAAADIGAYEWQPDAAPAPAPVPALSAWAGAMLAALLGLGTWKRRRRL